MDAERLGEVHERLLGKVWVVLDLESLWESLGVASEVHDGLTVVVGDTNALGQTLLVELLHGLPGSGKRGLGLSDLAVLVVPAWWVADRWVNVLQGDWEVDNVEVKVVDTPVLELLLADWLDALVVVERVPKLGDNEQLLTLDNSLLDGAGDTLTRLLLVTIV